MTPIQLDLSKLLGFKIVASEIGSKVEQVAIGAKLGGKPGTKTVANLDATRMQIGAKLGLKVGRKPGVKIGSKA